MNPALQAIASHYKYDPVGYCKVVLGITPTSEQEVILLSLLRHPYKTLVKSAHNVGKTLISAAAALWWFDTRQNAIVLATAPTERQIKTQWFKEVRSLRGLWGGFSGPKSTTLYDNPKHFILGFTATTASAFQGHHDTSMMVLFDEAVGVDPMFWESMETMLGGEEYCFLGCFNPTDQSSFAYTAERSGNYHVVHLSALTHPNILAELQGQSAPYPSAIRLGRLDELIRQWCTPLDEKPVPGDFEWPPGSGKVFRPGPVAEARLLGRWPTLACNSIWTEGLWDKTATIMLPDDGPVAIGCDPARWGDDATCVHVRKGRCSVHHEAHNGWSTTQTAARLRQLAEEFGKRYDQKPKQIAVMVDDVGVGGGVTDQAEGYNFVAVNSASQAHQPTLYPNRRSELWFDLVEEAAGGNVSFAALPQHIKEDLRRELLAPTYTIDYQGRRVVERKQDTKKRLGRSPDYADAVHLAYSKPKYDQGDSINYKPVGTSKKHRYVD